MTSAPRFLIICQPFFFTVEGDGIPLTRVPGDLSTMEGRRRFLVDISRLHPDLARGDGLAALHRAARELAHGQSNAGTVTDELRACFHAIAAEIRDVPLPPRERPRRTTSVMEEVLAASLSTPIYDPLDTVHGGSTWPKE